MARAVYAIPATIASGQSLSEALDVSGLELTAIQLPATWTAAGITFQGALDGADAAHATFQDLYDGGGTEIALTVVQAHTVTKLAAFQIDGLRWLKVRSGTGGAPVTQGASRTLILGFTDEPL